MLEGGQPDPPAILVLSAGGQIEAEVLAGIEEEGVPCLVERISEAAAHDDAGQLARRASSRSTLEVGVGIDRAGRVAVLHDKLPEPIEGLAGEKAASASLGRVAGHNAARIVVGMPLREIPR